MKQMVKIVDKNGPLFVHNNQQLGRTVNKHTSAGQRKIPVYDINRNQVVAAASRNAPYCEVK